MQAFSRKVVERCFDLGPLADNLIAPSRTLRVEEMIQSPSLTEVTCADERRSLKEPVTGASVEEGNIITKTVDRSRDLVSRFSDSQQMAVDRHRELSSKDNS